MGSDHPGTERRHVVVAQPLQRKRIEAPGHHPDDIYGAFVRNIAEARKLPAASVRDIAKGRVWTGSQAKALGLVDELGDMDTALGFAREAAGLPATPTSPWNPSPSPSRSGCRRST